MEGTPGFREAIWERMAALDIGSPYALAKRLDGRVSGGALYRYLCEGQELAADRLEVIFKVLGITLAIPAQPGAAPIPEPPDPPVVSDEPASPCIRS